MGHDAGNIRVMLEWIDEVRLSFERSDHAENIADRIFARGRIGQTHQVAPLKRTASAPSMLIALPAIGWVPTKPTVLGSSSFAQLITRLFVDPRPRQPRLLLGRAQCSQTSL